MNILATLNENDFELEDYIDRDTVKAVIINNKNEIIFFKGILVGGGVEAGETNEQTLVREAMEEVGIEITIEKYLGTIVQYRDYVKRKYIIHGYVCKVKNIYSPTTIQKDEQGIEGAWEKIPDALTRLEKEIQEFKKMDKENVDGDLYQRRIFHRITAKTFIEKYLEEKII